MSNYFNDKGECIDCTGLAKHCRETGQVFPLSYREALPGETLEDTCDRTPIAYVASCGTDSAAFIFDTDKNSWAETHIANIIGLDSYVGFSDPFNRVRGVTNE
jgi:hypothetical protein